MTILTLRCTITFLSITLSAVALASTPVGNISSGKDKAMKTCSACHGADGNKAPANNYPRLAGQYSDYLSKALHDYKSGKRTNSIMISQAQGLSEQEIADISAYFGSLKGEIHDLSTHTKH